MKEHVVYWSPWFTPDDRKQNMSGNSEWTYEEPISLWKDVSSRMSDQKDTANYFQCPAVRDTLSPVYIIKATLEAGVKVVDNGKGLEQTQTRDSKVRMTMPHAPSQNNQIMAVYHNATMFFSEEPLVMRLCSPWFTPAPHMRYGALVPGTFDIGRWFRPLNFEFNLWEGVREFHIEDGEPLAYIEFATDERIKFVRFKVTDELYNISNDSIHARSKKWKTLAGRYNLFDSNPINKWILKEVKANVL